MNSTTRFSPSSSQRCRWHWWQICHQWCTLTIGYLSEFSKKIEMTLFILRGLRGRWFMNKTWSNKSRDTVPLGLNFKNSYLFSCQQGSTVCKHFFKKLFATWIYLALENKNPQTINVGGRVQCFRLLLFRAWEYSGNTLLLFPNIIVVEYIPQHN